METNDERPKVSFDDFYRSQAHSDLYREYYDEIADIVTECIKETVGEGETLADFDRSAADDWLWESIDGHAWVIYTGKAALVPLVSDADGDAEMEDMAIANPTTEQRAFACMLVDCREELDRRIAAYEPEV